MNYNIILLIGLTLIIGGFLLFMYYEMKERQKILANAPIEKVLELTQGRLSSEQFFRILGY